MSAVVRCQACGAGPVAVVVHGSDGAALGYCEAHAPVRLAFGDGDARAAVVHASAHANPRAAAALYDRALLRLRGGLAAEAVLDAREAIACEPLRLLPRELLAEALEAAGDLAGALLAAREATLRAGADGETFALRARLEAVTGDVPGALASFEEGFARDAWSFESCRRAAILRMSRGELSAALALLERFLAESQARAALVIPVQVNVGPDAVPGAPPPATVDGFSSELAYREALRRDGRRRSHVVAAARYQARILVAHALVGRGLEAEAVRSVEAALSEIEGVPRLLLLEAGIDLEGEGAE